MNPILFSRVAVIGLGLLGSSLARALRMQHLCESIVGFDVNTQHMDYCQGENITDTCAASVAEAVTGCDLVVLCTPVSTYSSLLAQSFSHLSKGSIITDVGSVKEAALEGLMPNLPEGCVFVPAHPIAGSEKSGPEYGSAHLFESRRIILTPDESVLENAAVQKVRLLWERIGGKVEFMPAFLHDQVYGYVSHLPQVVAFAARTTLAKLPVIQPFSTLLFERFIRLGKSPALLWTDIFLSNQRYVVAALDDYMAFCQQIFQELRHGKEQNEPSQSASNLASNLFPRIAASCLVASVSKLEKQLRLPVARYTGQGFADVCSPAVESPEQDIEKISGHYEVMLPVLEQFIDQLGKLRQLIASGIAPDLLMELERIRAIRLEITTSSH
jgi:cyclohexadieny/prephenate dehydrogenase